MLQFFVFSTFIFTNLKNRYFILISSSAQFCTICWIHFKTFTQTSSTFRDIFIPPFVDQISKHLLKLRQHFETYLFKHLYVIYILSKLKFFPHISTFIDCFDVFRCHYNIIRNFSSIFRWFSTITDINLTFLKVFIIS